MQIIADEIKRLNIEKKIHEILFIKNSAKHSIEWGMNYMLFSPSKRIRPLLLLESNLVFAEPDNDAYILSGAIELIHTYSLVHDDLPCMDNDDLRRGVKTLHKIRNEAYALLVGDALLTGSMEVLSRYTKKDRIPEILSLFGKKAGYGGMIYGQMIDMDGENKRLAVGKIKTMYEKKTSALFELSLMLGAVNAGADKKDRDNLEKLGAILGCIFQLKDDILDISGDEKLLGKKTGSDEKNKKSSIPLLLGLKESEKILNSYKKEGLKYINLLPANKVFFESLLEFIVTREK
jgi:geranylgeranyl diphosphate synthase, type II